jgi:hypothetical protein
VSLPLELPGQQAGLIAAIACALLLLAPGAAGAHRFNAPTSAEIVSGGPNGARGTVSSPVRACEANRLVELFRVDELGGPPQSYGRTRTDDDGDWRVATSLFTGDYFVTVKRSRAARSAKKKPKHRHRCKRGRSQTKRL